MLLEIVSASRHHYPNLSKTRHDVWLHCHAFSPRLVQTGLRRWECIVRYRAVSAAVGCGAASSLPRLAPGPASSQTWKGREQSPQAPPWTADSWGYTGDWPLVAELHTPENRFHKPPWVESSSGDVPRGGGHPSSSSLPSWEAGWAPGFLKLRPLKALREVRDATDPKHGVLSRPPPHLLLCTQAHGPPTTSGKHRLSSDGDDYFDVSLRPVNE